jgi:hypothetical protein
MATPTVDSPVNAGDLATTQSLVNLVFDKLKELGGDEEPSRLFPQGISALELEINVGADANAGFRLALKLEESAATTFVAAPEDSDQDDTGISFNTRGHHIIALIAMHDLEQNAPDIAAKVQQILDAGERTLLEAAVFADEIRNQRPETKPFHFVDIPFKAGGPANPPLPTAPHVLSKIPEFTQALQNAGNAQERVDALSWLIHLFGDVHQPLHCIERTNSFHPSGDRGGNSFRLKGSPNNLHSLWDSSVNVQANLGEEEVAAQILETHSRASLAADLGVEDPEQWARAGFKLAKQHAYAPLTENPQHPPKPSSAYVKNMQKVGRRQAALAGYRLADRLRAIL